MPTIARFISAQPARHVGLTRLLHIQGHDIHDDLHPGLKTLRDPQVIQLKTCWDPKIKTCLPLGPTGCEIGYAPILISWPREPWKIHQSKATYSQTNPAAESELSIWRSFPAKVVLTISMSLHSYLHPALLPSYGTTGTACLILFQHATAVKNVQECNDRQVPTPFLLQYDD